MHLSGCDRIRARRSTKEEHNCAIEPLPGGTTSHDQLSAITLCVSGVAQNNPQTWGREKAGLALPCIREFAVARKDDCNRP